VGWLLLGWALLVVCVALPVWALTAGNLTEVAGWANILALPLTALGVVLVFAGPDRARAPDGSGGRRRPWMAPPLDRMVRRPELGGRLLAALIAQGATEVGLTTGLHGAGGFGKTRLATWVCHRPEIDRRYPGGLLWVAVGQEVRGVDLAVRINDLAFALSGQRPAISDPDAAGAELGRLLDQREPVLLVVDDVWEEAQLGPFRIGGQRCTRLVTTRIPDLLSGDGPRIPVDMMSAEQARQLVADGVAGLAVEAADRLANLAGRWPVLLNLVNGVLRRRVARGQPSERAANEIADRLAADGPVAFDPTRPADRGEAVAATVEASLTLLDPADQEHFLDLAVFPEDVDIPLDVLRLLWPEGRVDALCEDLVGLGLVADYRLDAPGPRLVLHDVMRAYLHTRRIAPEQAEVHRRLLDAAAGLLTTRDEPASWWQLPADAGYLWRYLPHHLHQAGRTDELAALLTDLRWVEAKTRQFGSVVPVNADLELMDTPVISTLRWALRRAAPLLGPIKPSAALGATLASRLHGTGGLEPLLHRYRATLARPLLEPRWPLPDQTDPTQQADTDGHTGPVTSCAFSPDGTLLATTSDDRTVRLWRVPDGAAHAVLSGHTGGVWDCAFSPDGALLATGSHDGTVRLWRVPDGATHLVLSGHIGGVWDCAFSPDGTLLATAGEDATVRLWQLPEGAQRAALGGHTSAIWGCGFSPDGMLLATASHDTTVRLWRVADHTAQAVLSGHGGGVRSCVFSADGTLLATHGNDRTVRLWQVPTGTQRAVLSHTTRVGACALSPDGTRMATASHDATVRLWRVDSGTQQAVLTGHSAWVRDCAFSPDGALLATVSNDQTGRLWRMADGAVEAVLAGSAGGMWSCAFSPDGDLLATTGAHGTAHLWRASDGTQRAALSGHTGRVHSCAFSPDGTLLATTGNDHTVRLWHVAAGRSQAVLTGHTGWVIGCAFSPDGHLLATTSTDRTVRLWRVGDGTQRALLSGHNDVVTDCAFSEDGTLLATTSSDETVRLWRTSDGSQRALLTGHTEVVNSCAFSPDGTVLATASEDRTVRLWRVADATVLAELAHPDWVYACAFSPDGTLLATTSEGTVRLWRIATRQSHCALRIGHALVGIAWHPNGTALCTVGGGGTHWLTYLP
jgi:WD40 repeat protein